VENRPLAPVAEGPEARRSAANGGRAGKSGRGEERKHKNLPVEGQNPTAAEDRTAGGKPPPKPGTGRAADRKDASPGWRGTEAVAGFPVAPAAGFHRRERMPRALGEREIPGDGWVWYWAGFGNLLTCLNFTNFESCSAASVLWSGGAC
jgi:hypothetical protein